MKKAWINKKLVDIDKSRISIFDRGFMYGDGVFETMRGYNGAAFKIDEHLVRLEGALKTAGMKMPYPKSCLKEEIHKLLLVNKLKSAYIRLTVTRGEGRFGIEHKDAFKPNVIIVAKEFGVYPERMFDRGISARVVSIRQSDMSGIAGIKSLNFMSHILARFEAKKAGRDEAILLNTRGLVSEATTSNVFTVKRRVIVTPSIESGILPGITRAVIIKIAKKLKVKVKEKKVSYKELLNSDEVFLTNSLAEVLPVTRIDRKNIGSGSPGNLTKLLRASYQTEVLREVS